MVGLCVQRTASAAESGDGLDGSSGIRADNGARMAVQHQHSAVHSGQSGHTAGELPTGSHRHPEQPGLYLPDNGRGHERRAGFSPASRMADGDDVLMHLKIDIARVLSRIEQSAGKLCQQTGN